MVFGYMRLPALLFGVGQYTVTARAARGRRAVPARQRHLPRHRGRRVEERQPDRHRGGGRAVAGLRRQDPRRSRRRGAQRVGGRRAVRRAAAAQRQRARTLQGRRRHPAGPHHGPARHQHGAGRAPTAACRRSRRTTSRPSSTRPTPRSAGSGPELSRFVNGIDRTGHRRPQEPRFADHSDRPVQAGAGLPDRHRRTRSRRGRRTWPPSPASCRARTPPWPGVLQKGRRRRRRGAGAVRPAAADAADRAGQPGQRRPGRGHLPAEPRAAAGAAAAGHRGHAGDRRRQTGHQAGLHGRLPELQPEPQPAAAVHHRLPAGPAAAGRRRFEDYPGPARRRPVLPRAAGLRRSTCAAPATCRARPCPANAHRR